MPIRKPYRRVSIHQRKVRLNSDAFIVAIPVGAKHSRARHQFTNRTLIANASPLHRDSPNKMYAHIRAYIFVCALPICFFAANVSQWLQLHLEKEI